MPPLFCWNFLIIFVHQVIKVDKVWRGWFLISIVRVFILNGCIIYAFFHDFINRGILMDGEEAPAGESSAETQKQ